jgi:cytochrome c553
VQRYGENLEGKIFLDDPTLAMLTAPNLTRGKGGLPADFSVSDWIRTLKHGVDRNGKALFIMPSHEMAKMSDEDMANLIAYCRQVKPVDNEFTKLHKLGIIGRILLVLDKTTVLPAEKIDHSIISVAAKSTSVSAEYGKYLSVGCEGCHRSNTGRTAIGSRFLCS